MATLRIAGGRVLRPDMRIEAADVLVDREAGEIVAVTDPGAREGDERLDASGGLVLPGLVNAHTHVAMTLLRGYADDKPLDRWLEEDVWPVEAELTGEDVYWGAKLGILEMIRAGVTAFNDMYFHVPRIVEAVAESGVRAMLGHTAITVGKDHEEAEADLQESLDVAREYDGAADGRVSTAFQLHSLTTVGGEYIEEWVPAARDLGVPIHFHANETENEVDPIVEREGKRPLVWAHDLGLLEPGDFLAHGVHLDREEIELLAETGAGVAHCPAANMKLASGIAPAQELLNAGVRVGIGTDGPASNNDLDLFDDVRDAAMVGKIAARDASAVDARTVVEMATRNGAALLGIDGGRIEAGAAADLAVLDLDSAHLTPAHDLLSHLAYAARGSDVRHTICDGEVLMRDRAVRTLDDKAVREEAEERAVDLIARATN